MMTLDIMTTAHHLNNLKPTKQEVSKLSRWLAIDSSTDGVSILLDDPSSIGSAGSDSFDSDSTHSSNASRRQSPQFGGQPPQYETTSPSTVVNEHNASQMGWNVNAKSFHPVSSIRHQSPPLSVHPQEICQQPMNDFSFPPPPITGNPTNSGQPMNQPRPVQTPYSPSFAQEMAVNPMGVEGSEMMGMWQDPNAGLKRWQLYTGTTIWGNPDEKVKTPIQRWQEFSEEDCVEMLTRLDERAKKLPGSDYGWGELPPVEHLPTPLQRVVQSQQPRTGSHGVQFHQQDYHQHHQQPGFRRNSSRFPCPPQQLLNNNCNVMDMYSQQQQMASGPGGWSNNNDGIRFGGPIKTIQQQDGHMMMGMGVVPNTPTFPPAAGFFENGWIGNGNGRMVTNGPQTPNILSNNSNVPLLAERQRNAVFPPLNHAYFGGGNCLGTAVGISANGGAMMKSIW